MVLPLRIGMTESLDFQSLTVRVQRASLKSSYVAMGEHWRDKMLPRHFIRGAGTRYGYKERTRKYLRKKEAIAKDSPSVVADGGRTLLVFSGQLRDHLTSGAGVSITGFPTRATIKLTAPHGLPLRPRATNRPNIGQELTAVTSEEESQLAAVAEKRLAKEIRSSGQAKRTQTKG